MRNLNHITGWGKNNHRFRLDSKYSGWENIFLLIIILLICSFTYAQDIDKLKSLNSYKSISGSYIVGGQLYNDNFIYNPGYTLQYTMGKKLHKDLSIGFGAAYMSLTNEQFIPIFLEIIGNKKDKDNTPIIRFQGGYSYGWDVYVNSLDNYSLKGGPFINAGVGRKIAIDDSLSIIFQLNYCHQFAKLEYKVFGQRDFANTINYDMFQISLGFLFE